MKEELEECDCGIIKILCLGGLRKIIGNLRQKTWYPDQDLNGASPGCDFSALRQHHLLSNSHVAITDDDNLKKHQGSVACSGMFFMLSFINPLKHDFIKILFKNKFLSHRKPLRPCYKKVDFDAV